MTQAAWQSFNCMPLILGPYNLLYRRLNKTIKSNTLRLAVVSSVTVEASKKDLKTI